MIYNNDSQFHIIHVKHFSYFMEFLAHRNMVNVSPLSLCLKPTFCTGSSSREGDTRGMRNS